MAKKPDNQMPETQADLDAPITAAVAQAEAPLEVKVAELEQRVAALTPTKRKPVNDGVSLIECNKRHREVMSEIREQNRNVISQVTKQLEVSLGMRRGEARRAQKDLAPHSAELKAQQPKT